MRWLRPLPLALVAALVGCDATTTFFQNIGVLTPNYRPALGTGAIRGRVVDRNGSPLVGARVDNGQAAFYSGYQDVPVVDDLYNFSYTSTDPLNVKHTLKLNVGEFVLTKVASGVTYVRATYDGNQSAAYQIYVSAGTFDITQTAMKNGLRSYQGLTEIGDLKVAVDGPVTASQSTSVELTGTNLEGGIIKAASSSTSPKSLTYDPSNGMVGVYLRTPPGSKGVAIDRAKITYFNSAYDPALTEDGARLQNVGQNPIIRSFPGVVTVLPGTVLSSGPLTMADVNAISMSPAFQTYLTGQGEIKAKIELMIAGATDSLVVNRNDKAISTVVSIQFRP